MDATVTTLVPADSRRAARSNEVVIAHELWSDISRAGARLGKVSKKLRAYEVDVSIKDKLNQQHIEYRAKVDAQRKAAKASKDAKLKFVVKERLKAPISGHGQKVADDKHFSNVLHDKLEQTSASHSLTADKRRDRLRAGRRPPPFLVPRSMCQSFGASQVLAQRLAAAAAVAAPESYRPGWRLDQGEPHRPQAPTPCLAGQLGLSAEESTTAAVRLQAATPSELEADADWCFGDASRPLDGSDAAATGAAGFNADNFELPDYLREMLADELAGDSWQECDFSGQPDSLQGGDANAGAAAGMEFADGSSVSDDSRPGTAMSVGDCVESLLPSAHPVRRRQPPPTVPGQATELMPRRNSLDLQQLFPPRMISAAQVRWEYCGLSTRISQKPLRKEMATRICQERPVNEPRASRIAVSTAEDQERGRRHDPHMLDSSGHVEEPHRLSHPSCHSPNSSSGKASPSSKSGAPPSLGLRTNFGAGFRCPSKCSSDSSAGCSFRKRPDGFCSEVPGVRAAVPVTENPKTLAGPLLEVCVQRVPVNPRYMEAARRQRDSPPQSPVSWSAPTPAWNAKDYGANATAAIVSALQESPALSAEKAQLRYLRRRASTPSTRATTPYSPELQESGAIPEDDKYFSEAISEDDEMERARKHREALYEEQVSQYEKTYDGKPPLPPSTPPAPSKAQSPSPRMAQSPSHRRPSRLSLFLPSSGSCQTPDEDQHVDSSLSPQLRARLMGTLDSSPKTRLSAAGRTEDMSPRSRREHDGHDAQDAQSRIGREYSDRPKLPHGSEGQHAVARSATWCSGRAQPEDDVPCSPDRLDMGSCPQTSFSTTDAARAAAEVLAQKYRMGAYFGVPGLLHASPVAPQSGRSFGFRRGMTYQ